jgi:hypothetical protein
MSIYSYIYIMIGSMYFEFQNSVRQLTVYAECQTKPRQLKHQLIPTYGKESQYFYSTVGIWDWTWHWARMSFPRMSGLAAAHSYMAWRQIVSWLCIKYREWCGRKRSWPILRYYPSIWLKKSEENHTNPRSSEIRIHDLSNTKWKC